MEIPDEAPLNSPDVEEAIKIKIEQDDYFGPVQIKLENTQGVREILKAKLMQVIEDVNFKINPDEKAIQTQAKIGIIHKASELLNDMDTQTFQFEKLKLSKKDNDINENHNKIVADFLLKFNPNISVSSTSSNIDQADLDIEKIMMDDNLAILPGEIV